MDSVRQWLTWVTEQSVMLIDVVALVVIVGATIQAVVGMQRLLASKPTERQRREVWMRYARWLIAGLTFQLAADIIETSITTSWEAIARVGAIAVIRTFLNYFLERDFVEVHEQQEQAR